MDSVIEDIEVKNTDQPQDLTEKSPVPIHFPTIVQSTDDSKRLFEFAKSRWDSALDIEHLEQTLSDIAKNTSSQSPELFKDLKSLRKHGLILLSAWNLFDEQHTGPKPYWQLINRLGKLNDDFFLPNASQRAIETSKALQGYLTQKETLTFKPASASSFQTFIQSVAQNMEKQITHAQINGEELHDVRKKGTRFLMNAYQIAHLANPDDPSFKKAFDTLHDADLQLGTIKDVMESQKSTLPLEKQTAAMPPTLRKTLLTITTSFK